MYELIINDYTIAECVYSSCARFPWSVQIYLCIGGKWYKHGKIKRYETLEQARDYCISFIRKDKKDGRLDK